jgi:hypothetical protein
MLTKKTYPHRLLVPHVVERPATEPIAVLASLP